MKLPRVALIAGPTPVHQLPRLVHALGDGPRLFIKRDDAIAVGFGGNKVRKLEVEAALALAEGADTLVTMGGVQSNHCRATAAVAARLGLRCVLVHNGPAPDPPTGNFLLGRHFGASYEIVASRADRPAAMARVIERLQHEGRRPYGIPLGASTPYGAASYANAVSELVAQGVRPDVIILASSSGGTQAGIIAGCVLEGLATRVIGVSADDPAADVARDVDRLAAGVLRLLGSTTVPPRAQVDDSFVGDGYGVPTAASVEAARLFATHEAVLLDPTYTAKAGASLVARARLGEFGRKTSVLFWHTGGLPLIFA
jgi:1-aminocyclopropane-1-carboxylate deaminase/D-cysteine desulfhydrase-like pyridoxal-dependent ACC family enzyme